MKDRPIKEDIEELEEILDGISDKMPQTGQVLNKINDMQLTLSELKEELERCRLLES